MKKILTLICALTLAACANTADPSYQVEHQTKSTNHLISGSGYDDLKGSVISYGYDGFDDFNLAVYNNKVKWLGQKGYFQGIARELIPQISKVAEGIYFFSWSTGSGGDNVVHNYNSMKVNAHLTDDSAKDAIWSIHGNVYNKDSLNSKFPHAQLTPIKDIGPMIWKNMADKQLPQFAFSKSVSHFAEDRQARNELSGLTITYDTPQATISIQVDGEITHITTNGTKTRVTTFATKIDDGIYFVSWEKGAESNHIIVNRKTMTVFDHISTTGKRAESIYKISEWGHK